MVGDMTALWTAKNTSLAAETRLLLLCMGRANIWNHAAFDPGEMAKLIGNKATARRARCKLIEAELAAPESTSQCIALSGLFYRRGDRGAQVTECCAEPSTPTGLRDLAV